MSGFVKSVPHLPAVLASLLLWGSFAWGLPVEAPAAEGEAEVAANDPWAGVRISDAYDYATCPRCGTKNWFRAESCSRCGYEFPQPSAGMTDPNIVFVPGKGYYREGTLLEPAKNRKGTFIAGLVLLGVGLTAVIFATSRPNWVEVNPFLGDTLIIPPWKWAAYLGGGAAAGIGTILLIRSVPIIKEPVYAFESGGRFEADARAAYALSSRDSEDVAFKLEVTALSF